MLVPLPISPSFAMRECTRGGIGYACKATCATYDYSKCGFGYVLNEGAYPQSHSNCCKGIAVPGDIFVAIVASEPYLLDADGLQSVAIVHSRI